MTSRDWSRVQAEVRERAFFMAAVEEARILSAFQGVIAEVAEGKINKARARELIRERLASLGYVAKPGTEGSIKDLSSSRRIDLVVDTNFAMVQNAVAYDARIAGAALMPGQQLVRLQRKKEPRNWPKRFAEAAATLPAQGVNVEEMAAHVMSAVWRGISDFGHPYPPFAFGSGMGLRALNRAKSAALLIDQLPLSPPGSTATPAQMHAAAPVLRPSLNEGLSASVEGFTKEAIERLERNLRGVARVRTAKGAKSAKIEYLEPNGSTPLAPQEVARVVSTEVLPGAPRYQYDAAEVYAAEGPGAFRPGSDALYDFARLVHRTRPVGEVEGAEVPVLWAGRLFASEGDAEFFISMLEEGLAPRPGWPLLACGMDLAGALMGASRDRYALPPGADGVRVVLVISNAVSARDLRPLLAKITGAAEAVPGVFLEAGVRLRVTGVETISGVRRVTCEEVKA